MITIPTAPPAYVAPMPPRTMIPLRALPSHDIPWRALIRVRLSGEQMRACWNAARPGVVRALFSRAYDGLATDVAAILHEAGSAELAGETAAVIRAVLSMPPP